MCSDEVASSTHSSSALLHSSRCDDCDSTTTPEKKALNKARVAKYRRAKEAKNYVAEDVTLTDFEELLKQIERDPEEFFRNTQKNVNKALLLYYLNSGYKTCDQYKEYDANSNDKELNKAKIMKDIQDQQLSDMELHSTIKTFFARHSYINASLMSCGCCGLRLRERTDSPAIKYKKLNLQDPLCKVLLYNTNQLRELELEQNMEPVEIPVDASFTCKKVDAWKIRSVYESRRGLGYFHLHPELIDIDD